MLDLAERPQGGYTPMKEVAARQEISLKYIEKIVPLLTKAGFIEGVHGKGGGYRLCRAPEDITAGEVLRATEGELAPVSCLECGAKPCSRAAYWYKSKVQLEAIRIYSIRSNFTPLAISLFLTATTSGRLPDDAT